MRNHFTNQEKHITDTQHISFFDAVNQLYADFKAVQATDAYKQKSQAIKARGYMNEFGNYNEKPLEFDDMFFATTKEQLERKKQQLE